METGYSHAYLKKGASSNPRNYRPISLTCVGSKIFESVLKNAPVPFLDKKKYCRQINMGSGQNTQRVLTC